MEKEKKNEVRMTEDVKMEILAKNGNKYFRKLNLC